MNNSIAKTSLNVLVIDESLDISNMLKKALFCTGHSATVFNNPEDGLKELSSHSHYDAVITDCFLDDNLLKSELAGEMLIDALLAINQLPILIWSLFVDKLPDHVQTKTQITLLKKPEQNLTHIFTWLANIKKSDDRCQHDTFPMYQLIYASRVIEHFSDNDLMDILNTAHQYNRSANISGALIYYKNYFLQVLEGEQSVVDNLFYNHISKDKRHIDVAVFSQEVADKRQFRFWDMGFFGSFENGSIELLGLTDFDEHPAGHFFKAKLTQSQKELLGIAH
jgi:CheY-like chemotaxis protein